METARIIGFARTGLESALTIGLAVLIGMTVWPVFAPPATSSTPPTLLASQARFDPVSEDAARYDILSEFDPFTAKNVNQERASASTVDAPETSLNLVLKGARATGDSRGAAVIQLPDNQQISASIGDEILDGVVLEYIFADRITLRRNGALENLFLREKEGTTSVILPAASDPVASERAQRPSAERASQASTSARASRGNNTVLANEFARGVQFLAVRDDGVRSGYRVVPRAGSDALAQAGFEPNDIIRAVNATPIAKIDTSALQLLISNGAVSFEVERGGRTIQIRSQFEQESTK